MLRAACIFFAVIAACCTGFGYSLLFVDEFSPSDVANVGMGLTAPMWRHYVQYCIIITITWPTVAFVFYLLFGTPFEVAVMRSACFKLLPLHFVISSIIFIGLLHRVASAQPMGSRDYIMGGVGITLFIIAVVANTFWRTVELTKDEVSMLLQASNSSPNKRL